MATIINGRENANKITQIITNYANNYTNDTNIIPNLAVILVGNNKASQTYVQAKISTAEKCGFAITLHKFDELIKENNIEGLSDAGNYQCQQEGHANVDRIKAVNYFWRYTKGLSRKKTGIQIVYRPIK